jgi:hypothetical protein
VAFPAEVQTGEHFVEVDGLEMAEHAGVGQGLTGSGAKMKAENKGIKVIGDTAVFPGGECS